MLFRKILLVFPQVMKLHPKQVVGSMAGSLSSKERVYMKF